MGEDHTYGAVVVDGAMAWDAAADVWSSMLPTRAGMLGILVQTSATVDPLLSLSSQRHAASCTVRKASCQCDTHVFAPKHATAQHSTHDVTIYEARRCCSVVVWPCWRGGVEAWWLGAQQLACS